MTGSLEPLFLRAALLDGEGAARRRERSGAERDSLLDLAALSFRETVAEALRQQESAPRGGGTDGLPAPDVGPFPGQAPTPPGPGGGEATVIGREAERTGIDASLLTALRRTENGGPGREFGVLSVDAPTLEAQARVAANSIRNSRRRFERDGGTLIDAASGQYSEAFLRFFSARYAPLGATNDPAGLNRYHAANPIANYRKAAEAKG